jgi:hypothetical protein
MDDQTVIKFPLTSGRHDPKHTVVPEILEQHPWHWGHMLQMANSFYPRWKSGDLYEIPMMTYHLSTNAGMSLKLTMSLSGAMIK